MATQSSNDPKGPVEVAATPFSIDRRALGDRCLRIRIGGELDLSTADRLTEALEEALALRAHVVVDLQPCSFLDSTGIAAILCARRQLADQGCVLCVIGARNGVERVLDITGLMASDLVKGSLEAALRACELPAATV